MLHVEVVELVERTGTEGEDTSYVSQDVTEAPTTVTSRMNHTKV
jgi:ribosomal protein S28E/S33